MSMIPAIANYFHITIDTLFGYNNDRDAKLKGYVKKGNRLLIDNDITECIILMRKALEEFPSEPELKMCLAHALKSKGFEETEKPNMYLEEAAALYEKLLEQDSNAIMSLLDTYSLMGEYDKAEQTALKQPGLALSREVLLVPIFSGEKGERYRGEAVLTLLHELNIAIDWAIAKNEKLVNSKEGIEISLAVRNLYEKIFGGESYGKFHSDLCMLNLRCVKIAANIKDYEQAVAFFDAAYVHYTKFLALQKEDCFEDDHFDTTLLHEVGNTAIYVIMCKAEHLKAALSYLPEEIKAQIINNPKYKEL